MKSKIKSTYNREGECLLIDVFNILEYIKKSAIYIAKADFLLCENLLRII